MADSLTSNDLDVYGMTVFRYGHVWVGLVVDFEQGQ